LVEKNILGTESRILGISPRPIDDTRLVVKTNAKVDGLPGTSPAPLFSDSGPDLHSAEGVIMPEYANSDTCVVK
jgi:hypothetical protein